MFTRYRASAPTVEQSLEELVKKTLIKETIKEEEKVTQPTETPILTKQASQACQIEALQKADDELEELVTFEEKLKTLERILRELKEELPKEGEEMKSLILKIFQ